MLKFLNVDWHATYICTLPEHTRGRIMKKRQRKIVFFLCMALFMSVLWGCGQTTEEETAEDIAIVEAANPEIGELKLSGKFIATINPDESVYVIPKATGEVLEVLVETGDIVQEGDVLALLDDTLAQLSMKNTQLSLKNAQLSLETVQHNYNQSFGEGASTLNDMQADNTITQAEDGVSALQENLIDAMDALENTKDHLREAEEELEDIKRKYDYKEDVDEIREYAESIDTNTIDGMRDYAAALQRYQSAAQEAGTAEAKITQYKAAIDQCEETIETIQDNIDSTYTSYNQAVTTNNIRNGEMLEEQRQVAQSQIVTAQNQISAAQLGIEQAEENLKGYTITATISGVVEVVNISEHDFASTGNPAFVISNKDTMVATYYVSEDVRNTFSIGQKITIEKDDKTYSGEIIEIGTSLDATTGLFLVKAAIKGNTSDLLSGTKATIITDTYHEKNAVIIPYDSVYYEGSQAYVYTVVDGMAKKVNIETGLFDTDKIVVTEGLTSDDLVITTWSAQLRENVAVSVQSPQTDDKTQE